MNRFNIPTKEQVTPENQEVFNSLEKSLGFVPNLYAYYAKNDTALTDYLSFQNRKSTLSKREIEVVNLVVSQYNGCEYCLSAHTVVAGLNGFSEAQTIEIRKGAFDADAKLDALANFTSAVVANKGQLSDQQKEDFFTAGYTEANLIDVVLKIGDKVVSNFIHNITELAIDFPVAPQLEKVA